MAHKAHESLSSALYRTSLVFLALLTAIVILAGAWDLLHQCIQSGGYRRWNIVILLGSYLVLGIVSLIIAISRIVTVRRALRILPKAYLPTKKDDVPKPVYRLIDTEYTRASVIAHISEPQGNTQNGWGRPGTEFEEVHFRTAVIDTFRMFARRTAPYLPSDYHRRLPPSAPPSSFLSLCIAPPPQTSPSSRSTSPSATSLGVPQPLLPPTAGPLLRLYASYLERALYAPDEPSEEDYKEVVKVVAVLVGLVEGRIRGRVGGEKSFVDRDGEGGRRMYDGDIDANFGLERSMQVEEEEKELLREGRRATLEAVRRRARWTDQGDPAGLMGGRLRGGGDESDWPSSPLSHVVSSPSSLSASSFLYDDPHVDHDHDYRTPSSHFPLPLPSSASPASHSRLPRNSSSSTRPLRRMFDGEEEAVEGVGRDGRWGWVAERRVGGSEQAIELREMGGRRPDGRAGTYPGEKR